MIRICELFAGIGGFSLAGENAKGFKTVYANQWNPDEKAQYAFECLKKQFPNVVLSNQDINLVNKKTIPDFDLLTAGFPCQDFSVAKALKKTTGLKGRKGSLFFQILDTLEAKKPEFFLLENVDRIKQLHKGEHQKKIIESLESLGYYVHSKVIDSSLLNFPQKRKRIYYFGSKNHNENIFLNLTPLQNKINLKNVLEDVVLDSFYLSEKQLEKAKWYKKGKKIDRKTPEGYCYTYSEGNMNFPDDLNRSSRTVLTSEGTINRSCHFVVGSKENRIRRITPVECERLFGFPDDWTSGMPDRKRYFCLGNSLIVPLVQQLLTNIKKIK